MLNIIYSPTSQSSRLSRGATRHRTGHATVKATRALQRPPPTTSGRALSRARHKKRLSSDSGSRHSDKPRRLAQTVTTLRPFPLSEAPPMRKLSTASLEAPLLTAPLSVRPPSVSSRGRGGAGTCAPAADPNPFVAPLCEGEAGRVVCLVATGAAEPAGTGCLAITAR